MPDMKLLLQIGQFALVLWTAWYAWSTARNAARQNEVTTLVKAINDVTTRVTALERDFKHVPDNKFMNKLATDLASLEANLEGLRREISPLAHQMGMLNQFLLNHK